MKAVGHRALAEATTRSGPPSGQQPISFSLQPSAFSLVPTGRNRRRGTQFIGILDSPGADGYFDRVLQVHIAGNAAVRPAFAVIEDGGPGGGGIRVS